MSSGRLGCGILATFLGKDDLRVPVTETLENLKIALAAAGATMEDLIKVNFTS